MSGRVHRPETVKQLLQTDRVKHRLFRTPEEIPFPRQQSERLHLLLCLHGNQSVNHIVGDGAGNVP